MEESHLSVQTFVRQIWREKTKQNSEIQINPGSVKTRKKKERKIRIIVSLLLTRNAERVHNIPLTHFDLQLHLYNFSFPAGCNCSPLKKKKECSWDREWKKTPKTWAKTTKQSIASTPSGLWLTAAPLLIIWPDVHIHGRCLLRFHFSPISSINARHSVSCYMIGIISPSVYVAWG